MVEFIRGNPVVDAFKKGQAEHARQTALDEERRVSEQKRVDSEVARKNAETLDRIIAKAKAPQMPTAQPAIQKPKGGIPRKPAKVIPVQNTSQPSGPPPAADPVPALNGLRTANANSIRAQAMLKTPSYRAEGLKLQAEEEQRAAQTKQQDQDREDKLTVQFMEMIGKDPQRAAAFARQAGLPIDDNLAGVIQDEWVRQQFDAAFKHWQAIYPNPTQLNEQMGREMTRIMTERGTALAQQQQGGIPRGLPLVQGAAAPLPAPQTPPNRMVQIVGPEGKPQWVTGQAAVGQQAYVKPSGNTEWLKAYAIAQNALLKEREIEQRKRADNFDDTPLPPISDAQVVARTSAILSQGGASQTGNRIQFDAHGNRIEDSTHASPFPQHPDARQGLDGFWYVFDQSSPSGWSRLVAGSPLPRPQTEAERDMLPVGSRYIDPEGNERTVQGPPVATM